MSGKYLTLASISKEDLTDISKKAIELAGDNTNVVATALKNLLNNGQSKYSRRIMSKIDTQNMTPDLYSIDLEMTQIDESADKTLNKAISLIRRNIKTPQIYAIYLEL